MTGALLWIGDCVVKTFVGLTVWLAVAVVVGIPVGRLLRRRSDELPRPSEDVQR
jgi:hypothetical protein